jgi:hypothetical protein
MSLTRTLGAELCLRRRAADPTTLPSPRSRGPSVPKEEKPAPSLDSDFGCLRTELGDFDADRC